MVYSDQNNQNRRSDLLRRKRMLENEQHLQRESIRAVERIKGKKPAGHQIAFFQRKSKKTAADIKAHPLPDQFRNTKDAVATGKRKRIKVGWRLVSGFLVVIFSALLLSAWRSPDYRVSQILINGNQRITQEEILGSFDVSGLPVFMIDPTQITTAILDAFPEFDEVRADITLPNQIIITVSEKQPIITWKFSDRLLWIDKEGYVLPVRGSTEETLTIDSFTYPTFYHSEAENQLKISLPKALPRFNNWKESSTSMTWYAYHRQIDPNLLQAIINLNTVIPYEKVLLFDPHRGLGWNDQRGWKIFVGFNLEHIAEKWLMYEKIVSELAGQGIQPTLISVEYLHAPYYRMD